MTDTTQLGSPVGTGDVIATDDLGATGKVQWVKLMDGTNNGTDTIPGTAASGLRVDPGPVSVADGGVLPAKGVQVGGTDGSVFQVLSTDNAGRLNANINGTVPVSNAGTFAVQADTELPAAAALADAAANPTVPAVGAFALLWNGATWDRCPGGATNGLTANLKALNGTTIDTNSGAKSAGTQRVILASDQTVVPVSDNSGSLTVDAPVATPAFVRLSDGAAATTALPVTDNAGSLTVDNGGTFAVQIAANSSVNVAQVAGTTTDTNSGNKSAGTQRVVLATDQPALSTAMPVSLASLPALATGSNLAGRVNVEPQTANGLSIFHLVSAATTNATNIKASAGQVYGWYIYNSNAAARKVVFHNTAGTPTAGASVIFAIVIPATSASNVPFDMGLTFATGIAITTVTDLTDAGATAVAANDLIINIFYK